jgi:hypothetical protein
LGGINSIGRNDWTHVGEAPMLVLANLKSRPSQGSSGL